MNIGATLVGQTIAFILFVWFCMKYVWPPLIASIEKRQQVIADGLAKADKAEKDLELAQKKAIDFINEAKAQANEIIEQANSRKNRMIDEAKQEAENERSRIIAQGYAEIETARNKAKEDLKSHVASLAMLGAERILNKTVDRNAQNDIVNQLITEI